MEAKKSWRESTWVVVLCAFLLVFTGLGFCSSPKSFFMDVVPDALGVGRSEFALNDTTRYAMTMLMSLFFGTLVSKYSTKLLIGIGFAVTIVSQLVYATADNVPMFCAGGALLGAGLSLVSNGMASHIVKRHVSKNTGTILGFVMAANGLGGAIATQMVSYFIDQSPTGYKNAYYAVAAVLTVVAVIVLLLYKEPTEIALPQPLSEKEKKKKRGPNWEGITFKEGLRKPYFYITAVLFFFTSFVLSGINGIAKAHWRDVGIVDVATIWSCHSLVLMGGKFIMGFFYDKKGLRFAMVVSHIISITVLLALAFTTNSSLGIALAWYYSIFSSFAIPLQTIGETLTASDLFGSKEFPKFLGILGAISSAGFAVGSPIINYSFDATGSYATAIFASAVIMGIVTVVYQLTITAAYQDRQRILATKTT